MAKEIARFAFPRLLKEMNRPMTSVILGARQVGKTHLLQQLRRAAENRGLRTRYYNLELPEDLLRFDKTPAEIFSMLTTDMDVVFFDEFYYLANASATFKAVYDSGSKVKIFASGSSATAMHKHLKESLAGRRLTTRLAPLDFQESLLKDDAGDPPAALDEYLVFGGLPGLIHEDTREDKMRLLSEILEAYIQKDVKSLIREENIRAFNRLLYLLAENQGSLVSDNGLSREVGLTAVTIGRHLSILEGTYVCHPVHSYARRLGNELKKSKKIYLYDLGIRNALLRDFSAPQTRPDAGALKETFVLLQLACRPSPDREIRFWRTRSGQEIDFVVLKNRRPFLIEVKSGLRSPEIPPAFRTFIKHYPETLGAMVVSDGIEAEAELLGKRVRFVPLAGFKPALDSMLA